MIDLNTAVTFQDASGNDFNLNEITGGQPLAGGGKPVSGYMVDAIGFGSASPIGYEDPKATSDGIDTAEAFAGRRIVTMGLAIYGSTRADLFQRIQNVTNLMRFMPKLYNTSDGFRQLKGNMITTDANFVPSGQTSTTIPVYFYVRPLQIPQTEVLSSQFTGSDALGYSAKMNLFWLMKYPVKYAQQLSNITNMATNGTEYTINNHGAAPADLQISFQSVDGSAKTTDIKVVITVAGTPLTFTTTDTVGADGAIVRSYFVDYKEQILYKREYNPTTFVTSSTIAMNLINVDSGALFATVEPTADLSTPAKVKVEVYDANTPFAQITSGYSATVSWREAWY